MIETKRIMPRILSIEDDPDFQHLISYALRDLGCQVYYAFSGSEGKEKATALLPDVILTDLMLPGANGAEILAFLKGREDTKDIPVIVMTAYSANTRFLEHQIKALGAVEYLRKPVKFNELVQLIKAILRERYPVEAKRS